MVQKSDRKLRLELYTNGSSSHLFETSNGMGVFYPNDGTPGNMDDAKFVFALQSKVPEKIQNYTRSPEKKTDA